MKILIFTGALENKEDSTSELLTNYLSNKLNLKGIKTNILKIEDSGIQ